MASREFVDAFVGVIKVCRGFSSFQGAAHPEVKKMATAKLQEWGLMFRQDEQIRYMYEVLQECRRNGMQFPPPPSIIGPSLVKTKEVVATLAPQCSRPSGLTPTRASDAGPPSR